MKTYNCLKLATVTLLLVAAAPALAGRGDVSATDTPPEPSALPSHENAKDAGVDFAADRIEYDQTNNIVTASGDVRMSHTGYKLRAATVIWNRTTGEVTATGQTSIISPAGDIAYGDNVKLTDTLKDGVIENLLVVMADGGRLVADYGVRKGDTSELQRATYSPCAVVDDHNCPKQPTWLITAKRVEYLSAQKKVRYHDARVEVLGVPIIYLPYFWHTVGNDPATGLLAPQFEITSNNGLELKQPFFVHFSNQRDLTLTPYLFTGAPPALQADFRQLTKTGAFNITLFGTESEATAIDVPNGESTENFRGYLDASGRFQLSPEWNIHGSFRLATDRTLLSTYELSYDDRLRENLTAERIGPTTYFSIDGWGTETMRPLESQAQTPIALPEIDYRKRVTNALLDGGTFDWQLNTLAISRTVGQDTQRAFVSGEWNLRRLTPLGQEVTFTAFGRGDLYHSAQNDLTSVEVYQGLPGWDTRAIGAVAADIRWPLIGTAFGGTQRLTPRVQIVSSLPSANLSIPNEDSRAIELDDTNLFSLNRFPGYDRWENGTRISYGVDWAIDRPGLSIETFVGQSYRFTSEGDLFPYGTGLSSQLSDIVGRTTIKYRNLISITHRYRVDKDNFIFRRNEFDATIGNNKTYFIISYVKLNRHIDPTLEDLQDHEELRLGGRIQFTKHWAAYGSTIVDLTTQALDPLSTTNGYSPVRDRLGIAYEDDCFKIDLSWRHDFTSTIGTPSGSTVQLRVAFRNLGR